LAHHPGSHKASADLKRAIAVDGKTLRGSRTPNTTAKHVMAAYAQDAGVVLARTNIDGKTAFTLATAPVPWRDLASPDDFAGVPGG
jgi:hypothetical protein